MIRFASGKAHSGCCGGQSRGDRAEAAEAAAVVRGTGRPRDPGGGCRDGGEGQVQGAFRRQPARPAGWHAGRKGGLGRPAHA